VAESRIRPLTSTEHSTTDHSGIPGVGDANPPDVTQLEAETGTETANRTWSPLRVAQAIAALASGGGGGLTELDKALIPSATSSPGPDSTGIAIAVDPIGWVGVYVNKTGPYELGDGVTNTDCFFSDDGGTTAKAVSGIAAGDILYWNGHIAGFDLDPVTDTVDLVYVA